jgi:hypothetical protein
MSGKALGRLPVRPNYNTAPLTYKYACLAVQFASKMVRLADLELALRKPALSLCTSGA